MTSTYDAVKRTMDIVISLLMLLFLSPVLVFFSLAIWLHDKHSPLFIDTRIGKDRKKFRLFKFRSMVIDADEIMLKNVEIYKQMRSGVNKMKDDPRVTKVGKFIRKYSIDELPQVINVLRGDMSIIGPRALRPDEFKLYEKKHHGNVSKLDILTSIKPGITGYWQVSGRSNVDFEKRMDMDCKYAKKKSILFDILILLKTPFAVIKGEGAY